MKFLPQKYLNLAILTGLFILAASFLFLASCKIDPQASMDSAYYYIMTDQLEKGKGFSEPFTWHFLKDYRSIGQPMDYWMPLGIILYYLTRLIVGAEKEVFINIAIWSLLTTLVYIEVKKRTDSSCNSLFASFTLLFCGRNLFYLLTSDNIAFYALFGFVFFKSLGASKSCFYLTAFSGGMIALTRIEGILVALFGAICQFYKTRQLKTLSHYLLILVLMLSPWMVRNYLAFEHPWPSSIKPLLMNSYNDMFCQGLDLTFQRHMSIGYKDLFLQRIRGLWLSILNLIAAPGIFILYPLWILAISKCWNREGKYFTWLLLLFLLFCGLAIPLQAEMGSALHISALFLPYLAIFNGVGLYQLQRHYSMRKRWYCILICAILSWALLVSLLSNKILSQSYHDEFEPYQSLLANVDLGERSIVSAIPVQLYYKTGARGVMLSFKTATEPIRLAELFGCEAIITDRRAPDYQTLPVIEGWQEIASNSLLNVYFKTEIR